MAAWAPVTVKIADARTRATATSTITRVPARRGVRRSRAVAGEVVRAEAAGSRSGARVGGSEAPAAASMVLPFVIVRGYPEGWGGAGDDVNESSTW